MSCNRSASVRIFWETTFSGWTMLVRSTLSFIAWTVKLLSGLSAAPYSMVVHYSDDHRNMKRLLSFFFFDLIYFFRNGAWNSAPHWLRSGGCSFSYRHVFNFYWRERLVSGECLFSFPHFPRQKPLISFGFSFSHFSIFCAVDFSYAYFAPHLPQFSS